MVGAWGLPRVPAQAAKVPAAFDGSKFQLKAPEPNPKSGGVLRYGITSRQPHFDMHQSATVNNIGTQGCMFDNLVRHAFYATDGACDGAAAAIASRPWWLRPCRA